jgi:hypothetical protein
MAAFKEALARTRPEDFDGHTEFASLTPAERLDWLCEAIAFVTEFKGALKRESQRE